MEFISLKRRGRPSKFQSSGIKEEYFPPEQCEQFINFSNKLKNNKIHIPKIKNKTNRKYDKDNAYNSYNFLINFDN